MPIILVDTRQDTLNTTGYQNYFFRTTRQALQMLMVTTNHFEGLASRVKHQWY
ncbi:MAG: hypothetical protein IPP72_16350 [Chitinophagaceae bacterium]|nr:hypothetical protein [Chitinophagaceae bacterium]